MPDPEHKYMTFLVVVYMYCRLKPGNTAKEAEMEGRRWLRYSVDSDTDAISHEN